MRILVTGSAGFIGSHLVEKLLGGGMDVVGIDCFLNESYDKNLKIENNKFTKSIYPNFEFHFIDLRKDRIPKKLENVTHIIHLAAMPGLVKSWSDTELYIDSNIGVTSKLLEFAVKNSIQKFIYISTSSVYGKNAVGNEESELIPFSPYGVTKLAGENLVKAYSQNFDLKFNILRYFSIFGPRQRPDMAYSIFIDTIYRKKTIKVFGDGEQTRTNTYIDDCVQGTISALSRSQMNEIYNISGGESVTINNLIKKISKRLNIEPIVTYEQPRLGDQVSTKGDFIKAKEHFGYLPKTGIDEGIDKHIEWYLKKYH